MPKTVFDARFFIEHYYSEDEEILRKTKEAIRRSRERHVSATVIHEAHQLTLEREGRETAVLRASLLEKDFNQHGIHSKR
jgi:hypothetical protein